MLKKAIGILVILSLIGIVGCSSVPKSTTTTQPATVRTIREAEIASAWTMKQLEVNSAAEITLVLTLASGDKVDGFYYLEKGTDTAFKISGSSLIYESQPASVKESITSDRFSFTASQAQGIAYTLTLNAGVAADKAKTGTTIFLEIIYPSTGSLYVPIGTK
jgi:type IV pilus biogenesis protein CpaD/CtpE